MRVKDAWLCKPTALEVIDLFRPTKDFVGTIMSIFSNFKDMGAARGMTDTKNKAGVAAAAASELSKLDNFLSQSVKDTLIPALKVRTHTYICIYIM